MKNRAATVDALLASLPPGPREALARVRGVILSNLDRDYVELVSCGRIGYSVPHSVYPKGHHCNPESPVPFAGLASQKGRSALYVMGLFGSAAEEKRFREEWARTGKRLDMDRACIRFRKADDLALDVLGRAIARMPARMFIDNYEKALAAQAGPGRRKASGKA